MEYKTKEVPVGSASYLTKQAAPPRLLTSAVHNFPLARDYFVWSLFNSFYMNICCIGFLALTFSVKSRDRKFMGDLEGCRQHASTARKLNIVSSVLCTITIIITLVMAMAGTFHILKKIDQNKPNISIEFK
ncbi:dispanin subfamily A member 2b-like [Chiloscyllium plagiosum]|uniref:dispanin subfamily A member 2b-like n=1 Tax=Chiloscyllium plagiosum TaxID=36176 RepID=UPI001CB809DC|nr:dispanin subfamily A member 2b-like [Chiloscyllium plagiosum]